MGRLTGKVAVVTGAAKGIGAAIAKELGAAGAAVVVNYAADREGAERVVGHVTRRGGKAVAVQADVARPDDVQRLFAETQKAFGRLDVLVNNAGIYRFAPLEEVTPEEFHRQFDVNVLGLILATQAAVARFGPEGGSVINVGSVASTKPLIGSVIYSATKGAVDTVTRELARELGPRKVRVNAINPGVVATEGATAIGFIGSDAEKQIAAETPLGRNGVPEDIAPIAVFLASEESGWLTGELLVAAGGYR
ncbi:MAG: glucose 1-dehydrogenase [bacterium]|nr:glucose 1-dehydrogenase [bacterium]